MRLMHKLVCDTPLVSPLDEEAGLEKNKKVSVQNPTASLADVALF